MTRAFVFVATTNPAAAADAVAAAPAPPDLCLVSPSAAARRTAAFALRNRWVPTFEESLLEAPVPAESEADVRARMVQALRDFDVYAARCTLVVCDWLQILARGPFVLDEPGLIRLADDLEHAVPMPSSDRLPWPPRARGGRALAAVPIVRPATAGVRALARR